MLSRKYQTENATSDKDKSHSLLSSCLSCKTGEAAVCRNPVTTKNKRPL